MARVDELRRKALSTLQEFEVLMIDGHFDYGNGYHGRVYLNAHRIFRQPSLIWRLSQDLLDVIPGAVLDATDVVAGPITGGALLAHTLAGLLDSRRHLGHEPTSFAPLSFDDHGDLSLRHFYRSVVRGRREVLVRVERAGDRVFSLSAARVMSTAAFRDLGDAKAFPVAARFFETVAALAKELGGSLVKTFGGLAVAAFERPGPAVEAALALQAAVDRNPVTHGLRVRVAVHRGPMMALTQSGRLDYFGQNVELALALAQAVAPGLVGLTSAVCQDVGVAERLHAVPDQLGMQPLTGGGWVLHVRAPSSGIVPVSAA